MKDKIEKIIIFTTLWFLLHIILNMEAKIDTISFKPLLVNILDVASMVFMWLILANFALIFVKQKIV